MGESLMKCTRASCSAVIRRSGMHGASLSNRSRPQHGLLMACPIVRLVRGCKIGASSVGLNNLGKYSNTGCESAK